MKTRWRIGTFLVACSFILSQLLSSFVPFAFAATSPWSQTNWAGGSGQTSWSDTTKYSTASNVTTSTANQITLTNSEELTNTDFETNLNGWSTSALNATGGTISTSSGDTIHTFTSNGTFTPGKSGNVWYLVVAGGGGAALGGGGAGGFRTNGTYDYGITAQSYAITVGNGGAGQLSNDTYPAASSGSNSIFDTITSIGGGGGANSVPNYNGVNGGSGGGGGASNVVTTTGGSGTAGQGNNGGTNGGFLGSPYPSGGGGGASAVGANAPSVNQSGSGGNGTASSISGASVTYAGGGGGACHQGCATPSSGGTGGGGGGTETAGTGIAGTPNTGGGGGAIRSGSTGGAGGSGIVIIRYASQIVTRDTSIKYAGAASAKLVNGSSAQTFTQSVNVGDTNSYNLSGYAYTDGSAVTSSDVSLYYNGSTVSTTYTSVGSGWYQLTGTVTGVASSVGAGVQVASGKTVYMDNFSLNGYASSGTLTSSIFDAGQGSDWGTLTYSATTPTNTTVSVKVRTSNNSDMSSATDFSSCTAITSGSDISSNSCVTDNERYVQYLLTLSTTDTLVTPTFTSFSLGFSSSDTTGPTGLEIQSPGNNSYINNTRPTFKWLAATDSVSSVAGYSLSVNNGSSGGFSISGIPASGTSDIASNPGYTIHFDGFNDGNSSNDYISVWTNSSSSWGSGQNNGELKEGNRGWSVTATDSLGNSSTWSQTVYVDLTSPNITLNQVNDTTFQTFPSAGVSTTDTTPTIFGTVTDSIAGAPGVSSGPQSVAVQIQQKNNLGLYETFSLATVNINQVTTGSESKYSTFSYTPSDPLPAGNYQITLSGKDSVGNTGGNLVFNLNVGTYSQIVTPEQNAAIEKEIEEQNPDATPQEKQEIKEKMEIVEPVEPIEPSVFENMFTGLLSLAGNIFSGTVNLIASVFNFAGQAIAFVWNQTTGAVAFIANAIGSSCNNLANHAPGLFGTLMISYGNVVDVFGQNINNIAKATGNGIASIAFVTGEKADDFSHTLGTSIIKIGYLFVPEPTRIYEVKVAKSTSTSMTITWTTNHPASSKVNYGLTEDYGKDVQTDKRITKHELVVKGLKPNTTYFYEVMSQNRNYVYDANHTFTTRKK